MEGDCPPAEPGAGLDAIAKVSYSHDAMIDEIVANPQISQNELAQKFGYTAGWVSQVVNSDAFRERLAQRREDVVDPVLRMSLEERIRGAVDKSIQVILDKLENTPNINAAIRVLEHGSRALGYGARTNVPSVAVTTYVALVPPKAESAQAWVSAHAPKLDDTMASLESEGYHNLGNTKRATESKVLIPADGRFESAD